MTSDSRDSAINATSGETTAGQAALIATFYGPRGASPTRSLHEQLYRSLARTPEAMGIPDHWDDNDTFLDRFDPPAAPDTTVIQLALNAPGSAPSAWETMRRQLENLLDAIWPELENLLEATGLASAWWGYTLTYQAVLASGADPVLEELLPAIRRLHSSESLQPLAQAEMSGGKVWLLGIPTHDDGLAAATIYVALSPSDKEGTLMTAIYGPAASLLMPDLISHKGYHQMRQYRGGNVRHRFEEGIKSIQKTSNELLESGVDQTVETNAGFEDLVRAYPRLIPVISILKELHISLVQQLHNYDRWRTQIKGNNVIEYHRGHLEMATSELELLVKQCQNAIDTADMAVSMARDQVSEVQANRQWWIATLLGVVGLAVSLRGILAREDVEELLGLIPMLEPQHRDNFFVQLGTQIGIVLICALVLVLVVTWIRKRGRKKRISVRE